MYQGQDLVSLMSALDELTADGVFQYDFNVGTVIPYLKISISKTMVEKFPSIQYLALTQPLLDVFYTLDFSAPVEEFIAELKEACAAYASSSLSVWQEMYNVLLTFQDFLNLLSSKVKP